MRLGIILTPDVRSKAYLQKIIFNKINQDMIIFLNDKRVEKNYNINEKDEAKKCGFDISEAVNVTLTKHKLSFKEFNFVDINHPELTEYLKHTQIDFFVFSGGGVLKSEVLSSGPRFIHLHPGITPQYRGSTCFYYSIINEDRCGVTAFVMDEGLDTGPVIYQKIFDKPNHIYIDEVYDAHIRSETLIDVLKNNRLEGKIFSKKTFEEGNTYFIIHPVLKHIAILNCVKNKTEFCM